MHRRITLGIVITLLLTAMGATAVSTSAAQEQDEFWLTETTEFVFVTREGEQFEEEEPPAEEPPAEEPPEEPPAEEPPAEEPPAEEPPEEPPAEEPPAEEPPAEEPPAEEPPAEEPPAEEPPAEEPPTGESETDFTADLSGENEVDEEGNPGVGDPDGSGQATITLAEDLSLCWSIAVEGITLPAAAAHIHEGEAGVNGPIVVPLSPPDAEGTAEGCTTVTQALHDAILADPGGYYANVHTTDFPDGAVRGQLQSGEGDIEAPRPGDQIYLSEDLFESDSEGSRGDQIGSTLIQCTFGLGDSAQCSVTVFIDERGQLSGTATPIFDFESEEPLTVDVAFTGGTEEFARAGGWAQVTDIPPEDPAEPLTSIWEVQLEEF